MSDSIKMSPKHGLNPCIPVCFFCGKQKNEIALMGKLKGDAQAPMSAVINYDPCDECYANWQMGVPLIRVSTKQPVKDAPPLQKNDGKELYPTGQYVVMTQEGVSRVFGIESEKGSPVLIEDDGFDNLMAQMKEPGVLDDNGDKALEQ